MIAYHRPQTLPEALDLLHGFGAAARPLAGGQSLMPLLKGGIMTPDALVDLAGIPELRELRWDDVQGLSIGAMVTQRELETSPLVRDKCPALAGAISRVASVPVRNLGTLGGNLCHAAAGADPPAILIALHASVQVAGRTGTRTIPVADLFAGPYETVLAEGEILTLIQVPPLPAGTEAVYLKHSVRAIDPAIVGVAAVVELQDGLVRTARIGMVGTDPRPSLAASAVNALIGRPLEDAAISEAAKAAANQSDPPSDGYASGWYRRKMVAVFVKRALGHVRQSLPASGPKGVSRS